MLDEILKAMFVFSEESKITPIACWIILTAAFVSLMYILRIKHLYRDEDKKEEREERLASTFSFASTIFPLLGILGTFFGILYGLIDFDIREDFNNENINNKENFSGLIEGLKIAFSSSVLGLFFSLVFRVWGFVEAVEIDKDASGKDIQHELQSIRRALWRSSEEKRELDEKNQAKLILELERIRQVLLRGFQEQKNSFEEFADKVVTTSVAQIVKALEKVIKEFNTEISEQLGENFKKFNEALGRLIHLQEYYEEQLENMDKTLKSAVESMSRAEGSLIEISESASTIPENMRQLREVMGTMNRQIETINDQLKLFIEVRERTNKALADTQRNLNSTSEHLQGTLDSARKTIADMDEVLNSIRGRVQGIVQDMVNQLAGVTTQFVNEHKTFLENAKRLADALNDKESRE